MGEDARWGPLWKNVWQLYTHYGESSESLEGDRGRYRVQRCHFLTSFQGPYQKMFLETFFLQNSASKMAKSIVVDIVKYLY